MLLNRIFIVNGLIMSRLSVMVFVKFVIVSIVNLIVWLNCLCFLVVFSFVRWGRSDFWMVWKSCSGACAISSVLKT